MRTSERAVNRTEQIGEGNGARVPVGRAWNRDRQGIRAADGTNILHDQVTAAIDMPVQRSREMSGTVERLSKPAQMDAVRLLIVAGSARCARCGRQLGPEPDPFAGRIDRNLNLVDNALAVVGRRRACCSHQHAGYEPTASD